MEINSTFVSYYNMILTFYFQRKHPAVLLEAPSKKTSEQPTVDSYVDQVKKYGQHDRKQKSITDALVLFVADDLMPLSVVDSDRFRELLRTLDPRYTVPSRKHLSDNLLKDTCKDINDSVISKLRQAQNVCLTIDLWSNRQMRGFIGITAHFILDWTMQSAMLACKRFKGRHTAENILQQYEETVASFDVAQKTTDVVTDNASNMTKAFSLPGYEADVSDSEGETDDEDSLTEDLAVASDVCDFLPEHHPCFAHTLNLVVKDGLKNAGQLSKVIQKASKVVSYVRKSIHATEYLENEGELKLQAANATRWNSELRMIRSVLRVPHEKLADLNTVTLTQHDRNILKDLIVILAPFEEATNSVQGQNIVTSSMVVPCVRGLKLHLRDMTSRYNNKLVETLRASVDKRLTVFEEREAFVIASCLDPRFKLDWCATPEECSSQRRNLLFTALADVSTRIVANDAEDVPQEPPRKRSKLFSFMDSRVQAVTPVNNSSVEIEIQDYLSQPCLPEECDPLEYWKVQESVFPTLAKLARHYLGITATSAPVERLFSIAGKIFRPERCNLGDIRFQELMFIRCNSQ